MRLIRATHAAIGLVLVLSGCGSHEAASTDESAPSVTASSSGINSALPREAVAAQLTIAEPPTYGASDDTLRVSIRINNNGKVTLVSAGTAMVRLGAMLMGPHGPDQSPGNRDFVRIPLPAIAPGSTVTVESRLPAAALVNLPIRFELVQEGVNWFSVYGQEPLQIGPYKRCERNDHSLCGQDNRALGVSN